MQIKGHHVLVTLFAEGKSRYIKRRKVVTKTLRIMKLTAIILLATCIQVTANTYSQSISLSVKDAPLERVFAEIEKQTDYSFIYETSDLKNAKPVTLDIKDAGISETMDLCLKDQKLAYRIIDKMISIKTKKLFIFDGNDADPPLIDIKGRIVNEKGEPVIGASVRVRGTNKGTHTNDNGEFELSEVEENATLQISSVNIESIEWKIAGKKEIFLKATSKITEENEVTISTGYQKIRPERFVGSVSQLDSSNYHRRAGMGIIERLDGTVSGVLFDKKGTNPIQIRGISTLKLTYSPSQEPLVIVDNFPFTGNINTINPNDVESITVLKDAAAASIWGARAGNGVIVITTKRGKYNQPFQVSVSSNVSVQEKPDLYYYPQMDIGDFVEIEKYLYSQGAYASTLTNPRNPAVSPVVEVLDQLQTGTIGQVEADAKIAAFKKHDLRKDLDKYVYQKALLQQHYVNFSGGRDNISYNFSAGYNRNRPNIRDSKSDEQYTINSNTAFRPIKNLEINTGINFTNGINKSISNTFLPNLKMPYLQLADDAGNPSAVPHLNRQSFLETTGGGQLLDWMYRPLDEIRLADNTNTSRFTRLNLGGRYQFTKWLSAEVAYQYMNQTSNTRNLFSEKTFYTRNLINLFTNLSETVPYLRNPIPFGDILNISNLSSNSRNLRGQLNFNWNWKGTHSLNALIAGEQSQTEASGDASGLYGYNNFTGSFANQIDFVTFFPIYGNLFGSRGGISSFASSFKNRINRVVSLVANTSYTYKGRYSVYASARRDGSNVFGVKTNNKWKPLWSIGAGWDVSKENFDVLKWLPTLRFTTSYGYTGNVNNEVSGVPTITYSCCLTDFSNFTYAQVGQAPNPNLRWEQVRILNVGIDFGLLRNRLAGRIEYFTKRSTDLISAFPFPPSTGVGSFYVNASSLKGQGLDANLNSVNTVGAVKWETRFGLSHAKIIVTKLYTENKFRTRDFVYYSSNPSVGKIVYGLSSFKWGGLDPNTGVPLGFLNGKVSDNFDAIFNDSVDNQVFHGSAIPLYNGYLINSLSWKNITISANITYRLDFYFRIPTLNLDYTSIVLNGVGHADYARRWQKPGDELVTNIPSVLYPGRNADFYSNSEISVRRGDNIRLQDVRLSYNWNNKNYMSFPAKSIQVFIYANNLNTVLWKKADTNLDPDFVGAEVFTPPTPKMFTGGISITF